MKPIKAEIDPITDLEYYQGLCDRIMQELKLDSVGEIIGAVITLNRRHNACKDSAGYQEDCE